MKTITEKIDMFLTEDSGFTSAEIAMLAGFRDKYDYSRSDMPLDVIKVIDKFGMYYAEFEDEWMADNDSFNNRIAISYDSTTKEYIVNLELYKYDDFTIKTKNKNKFKKDVVKIVQLFNKKQFDKLFKMR